MSEPTTATDAPQKRPLLKRAKFWIPASIVLVLAAGGVAAAIVVPQLMDRAYTARDALEEAIPLAATAKQQILSGDAAGAQATAAHLAELTAVARTQTEGSLWSAAEGFPVVGNNLTAVRTVADVVDDLVTNAVEPASHLSIASLAPSGGRIDTSALTTASTILDQAATSLAHARTELDGLNRTGLVDQVASGVQRLDNTVSDLEPLIAPAQKALAVLPGMLGAEGPRNYLVMVQNNAESRGTGGNPAALVMVHVENGAISIAQQASSSEFQNGRPAPIVDLDAATVDLYGDKVGRYMQDVTTTPDFTESARIMGAFWAESIGTPIDGTLSIDPVALGYLLAATGPVTLPNGDVLDSSNAVSMLLNRVYFRYSDPAAQDEYFASAASAVFDALTSVQDPRALVDQVVLAVDEGRILYVPTSPAEAEIIAGSRLTGRLPSDNAEVTMVGSYVNDVTEGKLDYYMDTAVSVSSDVCTVGGAAPTFQVDTTLTSTLQPGEVSGLAQYISPGNYFPRGVISTDLVVYGPVGASVVSASVDGAAVSPRVVEHLGRPAVKINVVNNPASTHAVSVVFSGTAGAEYGPVVAWHTPMVRPTPVTIDTPGCAVEP